MSGHVEAPLSGISTDTLTRAARNRRDRAVAGGIVATLRDTELVDPAGPSREAARYGIAAALLRAAADAEIERRAAAVEKAARARVLDDRLRVLLAAEPTGQRPSPEELCERLKNEGIETTVLRVASALQRREWVELRRRQFARQPKREGSP